MKRFVVVLAWVAACGTNLGDDEPTRTIAEEACCASGAGSTGGANGVGPVAFGMAGLPSSCPDGSQGVSVTLQAGVTVPIGNTHAVWIDEANPNTNSLGSTSCYADGDTGGGKDQSCLLRWDVAYAVPQGKTVLSAWLQFHIVGASSERYDIYPLVRLWDASSTNWNNAKSKTPWQVPGAKGAQDRGPTPFSWLPGGLPVGQHIEYAHVPGIRKVQDWVNDPKTNFGLIIAHPTNTDGVRIRSSASATPSERPGLGIRYCP